MQKSRTAIAHCMQALIRVSNSFIEKCTYSSETVNSKTVHLNFALIRGFSTNLFMISSDIKGENNSFMFLLMNDFEFDGFIIVYSVI